MKENIFYNENIGNRRKNKEKNIKRQVKHYGNDIEMVWFKI